MKKLPLIVLAILLVFVLAPCLTAAPKLIRIAHMAPDQDVAQTEFQKGIAAEVKRINAEKKGYTVQYDIYNCQFDIQTQIGQVETAIEKKYDLIIMFGTDSEGAAPVVKKAHDAGIKIIDICDMGKPEIRDLLFLGNNEKMYQDLRDKWLLDYLAKHPKQVPLKTGIIYGNMNQLPQLPRGDRMKELAAKYPDKFKILVTGTGEWYADKAQALTEDWITAFPEMNFYCVANDQMAIGVVQALKAAHKLNYNPATGEYKTIVTGIDVTDEGLQMVKRGEMAITIGVDNFDYATELIRVAVRLANGEKFPPVYAMQKTRLITKDNVDAYIAEKAETKKRLGIK